MGITVRYRSQVKSNINLVGYSIATLAPQVRELLDIPANTIIEVNHEKVDPSYILKDGDSVEFVANSGQKG